MTKIQSDNHPVKQKAYSAQFCTYWQRRAINPNVISAKVNGEYIEYYTQVNGTRERFQRSKTVDWIDTNQHTGKATPHKAFERLSFSPTTAKDIPLFVSPDIDYADVNGVYVVEGLPDAYTLLTNGLPAIALKSKGALQRAKHELTTFLEKFPNITEFYIIPDPDGWQDWTQCHLWWELSVAVTFINIETALNHVSITGKDVNDLWIGLEDHEMFVQALHASFVTIVMPSIHEQNNQQQSPGVNCSMPNNDFQSIISNIETWFTGERMAEYAYAHAPQPSQGVQEVGEEIEIRSNGGFYIKPSVKAWRIYGKNAGGIGIFTLASYLRYGQNSIHNEDFLTLLKSLAEYTGTQIKFPQRMIQPPQKPQNFHLTDSGNAQRFISIHGENIHYCPEHDKWFVWSETHWHMDIGKNIMVYRYTADVIKHIYKEASESEDSDTRKEVSKWARKSESKKNLQDMVFLAAREPGVPIKQHQFDMNPFLLNVANGTLDLSSGKLLKFDKKHMITKILPLAYNPKAECPEWLNFLNTIMAENEGLIEFLRRAMGYTLTGDVSEDCLFFLYGTGKNGKSTFVNIMSYVLGEYRQHLKIESLLAKRYEGIPNDIAQLPGARLVTTTEIPEYRRLNESLIKDLTGGDAMTARFMRGEYFTFTPIFKLWMFGNHKPQISGTDDGIWRRIRLVPFTVQIQPQQRLPRRVIEGTLKDEAEGILAWMVRGCLDWQKTGLQEPSEILDATKAYRSEMDALVDFFEQYTVTGVEKVCTKKELYNVYVEWSKEIGKHVDGARTFNEKVRERFPSVIDGYGTGNRAIFKGIGLID